MSSTAKRYGFGQTAVANPRDLGEEVLAVPGANRPLELLERNGPHGPASWRVDRAARDLCDLYKFPAARPHVPVDIPEFAPPSLSCEMLDEFVHFGVKLLLT